MTDAYSRTGFLLFWGIFAAVTAAHIALLTIALPKHDPLPFKAVIKKIQLHLASSPQKAAALPKGEGLGFAPKPPAPVKQQQKKEKQVNEQQRIPPREKYREAVVPLKKTQPLSSPPVQSDEVGRTAETETAARDGHTAAEGGSGTVSSYGVGGGEGAAGSPAGEAADIQQLYALYMRNTLLEAKRYPRMARKKRLEGEVKIAFVVARDGVIRDIRITSSSPHALLNEATVEAVRSIGRFRPLPPELGTDALKVTIPFNYRLER